MAADVRPISRTSPSTCRKIKYSNRSDTPGSCPTSDHRWSATQARLLAPHKVKGFQVAPAELEAVLRTHSGVADAAVIAVADERAGERPKAFVVRACGVAVSADELVAYVAGRVAPHKRVEFVEFVDVIPTPPAGKTLRRVLRDRARPVR